MEDDQQIKVPGVEELDGAADFLSKKPLELNVPLCVRARHRGCDCQKCMNVCSRQAVVFDDEDDEPVSIDFSLCNGCGACVTACPTGVFTYVGGLTDFELLKKMSLSAKASDSRELYLSCRRVTEEIRDKTHEMICFGRLHEGLLVGAAKFGAKKVFLTSVDCKNCDFDQYDFISKYVGAVADMTRALGFKTEYLQVEEAEVVSFIGKASLIEKEQPTRRELLGNVGTLFKQATASWAEKNLSSIMPKREVVVREGFTYEVPYKRKVLLKFVKEQRARGRVGSTVLPFGDVTVDSRACDLCRDCVNVCPTTAIALEEHSDGSHLIFYPAYCTHCGVCDSACRQRALSLEPGIKLPDLITGRGRALKSAKMKYRCIYCQQEFPSEEPSALCPTCFALEKLRGNAEVVTTLVPVPVAKDSK